MRLCALALCVLLFSGCAIFGGDDGTEPLELVEFEPRAELDVVWRARAGAGTDGKVVKLHPAIDGERLYAADAKGKVFAYRLDTGDRLWSRNTDDPITGAISSHEGMLLYGTGNGDVVALDNGSGEELWRRGLTSEVISVPRTNGEIVAAQSIDGVLHALDAGTGERLWRYENRPPVLTLRGTASPMFLGSRLIAAFATGKVMAFNPSNGLIEWERRVALPQGRSEIERMVDIDADPLVFNNSLYVATYQGKLMSVNRSNGRPLWEREVSTHKNLAGADRTLYLSQADSRVTAFSAATGEKRWENEQMLRRDLGGPQVLGDYLAVGDFDGYLHLLDRSDGSFVARDRLGRKAISGAMLNRDDTLYVQTDGGRLYALRARALEE